MHRNKSMSLFAFVALAATAVICSRGSSASRQEVVDLGSAAHFAILAGSAITSTGGGTNYGDIGLSPASGAAITGLLTNQVNGTIYTVDAAGPLGSVVDPGLLYTAKVDLTSAYLDGAGRTNADVVYPAGANIGGLVLGPGIHKFPSTAYITGYDVTLTGVVDDVWIFQVGSGLTVGSGIDIVLSGGAKARNIFWMVGSSATLGTYSSFKGSILADQSITMNTGCSVEGRALASEAQVTFDGRHIGLPDPEAPRFTDISRIHDVSATVVVATTPYFRITLQVCPDLKTANWKIIAADTPVLTPWIYVDTSATADVPIRFYRAYLTR